MNIPSTPLPQKNPLPWEGDLGIHNGLMCGPTLVPKQRVSLSVRDMSVFVAVRVFGCVLVCANSGERQCEFLSFRIPRILRS